MVDDPPFINCFISASQDVPPTQEAVAQVISVIRPNWNPNAIVWQSMSGGYLNLLLRCHEESNAQDSVVLRIWSTSKELQDVGIINRDFEGQLMKILGDKEVAPTLLAVFQNGLCFEFFHGELVPPCVTHSDDMIRLIMKALVGIHTADLQGLSTPTIYEVLENLIKDYPAQHPDPEKNKRLQQNIPSKASMIEEVKFLENYMKQMNCPNVLCHGDVHPHNIMWNKNTKKLIFIDFEMCYVGPQPVDIVGLLMMMSLDYNDFSKMAFLTLPEASVQKKWLRIYLEYWFEATGRSVLEVTDKDIDKLFVQVNKFFIVLHFMLALIHLKFIPMEGCNSDINKDYASINFVELAINTFRSYYQGKDCVISLEIPN